MIGGEVIYLWCLGNHIRVFSDELAHCIVNKNDRFTRRYFLHSFSIAVIGIGADGPSAVRDRGLFILRVIYECPSMPYSAVTQPRPWPLSQGGRRSSRLAVTRTWVSPNFTKHEPSAYFTTPRSSETARNSSICRRLGRIRLAPGVLIAHHNHTPRLNKTTSMVNCWLIFEE